MNRDKILTDDTRGVRRSSWRKTEKRTALRREYKKRIEIRRTDDDDELRRPSNEPSTDVRARARVCVLRVETDDGRPCVHRRDMYRRRRRRRANRLADRRRSYPNRIRRRDASRGPCLIFRFKKKKIQFLFYFYTA